MGTSTSTKKILVIDDEEGIRESLKLILENHYNLILTGTREEALDIIDHADDIELVLLDIKMPRISGLEILDEIKQRKPDMKVVMVTGYRSVETASEASQRGACGYIVKPFDSKDILEAVAKHMGN